MLWRIFGFLNYLEYWCFSMKGIGCRNVEKFVGNHNREVQRIVEGYPASDVFLENVIGIDF